MVVVVLLLGPGAAQGAAVVQLVAAEAVLLLQRVGHACLAEVLMWSKGGWGTEPSLAAVLQPVGLPGPLAGRLRRAVVRTPWAVLLCWL